MSLDSSIIYMRNRLTLYSDLAREINIECQYLQDSSMHSDLSLSLVNCAHYSVKYFLFLMLKTLLRFSDLKQIDLQAISRGEAFSIFQDKTQKPIKIFVGIYSDRLRNLFGLLDASDLFLSYDRVARSISVLRSRLFGNRSFNFKSDCHIFRHLEATFLYDLGYDFNYIAKKLGDDPQTVKTYYLHNLQL